LRAIQSNGKQTTQLKKYVLSTADVSAEISGKLEKANSPTFDMEGVRGSIPLPPTIATAPKTGAWLSSVLPQLRDLDATVGRRHCGLARIGRWKDLGGGLSAHPSDAEIAK